MLMNNAMSFIKSANPDLRFIYGQKKHYQRKAGNLPAGSRSNGLLWTIVALILLAPSANYLHAQVNPAADEHNSAQPQSPQSTPAPASEPEPDQTSEAEMISGIGQLYEMDRGRLKQLQAELQKIARHYNEAEKEFDQLNRALVQKKEELKSQQAKPQTTSAARQLASLEKHWQLAKERFDLVIQQRKALQTQMETLAEKTRLERATLDRLTGAAEKQSPGKRLPPPAPAERKESASGGLEAFGVPGSNIASPAENQPTAATRQTADPMDQELPTESLLQARSDLQDQRLELKNARDRLLEIDRAIKLFDTELKAEQQLLEIARKQVDNTAQTYRALQEEPSVPGAAQNEHRRKTQDAEQRLKEYRNELEQRTVRIRALSSQLENVKNARATTEERYQEAAAALDSARQKVEWLESPWAPEKIYQWFFKSGPKILAVLLLIGLLLWLARALGHRIVRAVAGSGPGSMEEREKRSATLVGVFNNGTTVAIIVFGALMLLQASGINVSVLLGGAAVVGVAVAFGAQNLTRDYFSGFVMLLENQYGVNDIVRIGGIAGLVERITLRMTVLRDLEGVVHFIPHGEVTTVSNLTHGWSRALFEIGVAYKEDADRVMKVLLELGKELRQDPFYGDLILEDLEMLGVDSFGDSAVVIKFYLKTRPQKQFTVKRELLRRIKRKFDELGIEIPFPHRTVYHRGIEASPHGVKNEE